VPERAQVLERLPTDTPLTPLRCATALRFLASLVYRPQRQCLGVRYMELTRAPRMTGRDVTVPTFVACASRLEARPRRNVVPSWLHCDPAGTPCAGVRTSRAHPPSRRSSGRPSTPERHANRSLASFGASAGQHRHPIRCSDSSPATAAATSSRWRRSCRSRSRGGMRVVEMNWAAMSGMWLDGRWRSSGIRHCYSNAGRRAGGSSRGPSRGWIREPSTHGRARCVSFGRLPGPAHHVIRH